LGAAILGRPSRRQDISMFQLHPFRNELLMLVTTNTHHRQPIFRDSTHAREAIETLYRVQQLHPFFLFGFVIMPDHCHLLIRVPEPESVSRVMRMFKQGTSMNIGRGPLWQTRFHIRLLTRGREALHYIHHNPVKAHLVMEPEQYPYSSACGRWDITPLEE
jgi:putative transposase